MARSRRGGFVIIVAVSMTVLTGMVALAFDIGYARLMRARVEMALEAASHAAAQELDFTDDGVDRARDAAISMAGRFTVMGETLSIASDDIDFGTWDDTTGAFSSDTDAANINGVRINTSVNVPLMFGAISFADSDLADGFNIGATTVATMGAEGGAASITCGLPLAIPLCAVDNDGDGAIDGALASKKFDTGGCAGTFEAGYSQAYIATPGTAFSYTTARNAISDCENLGMVEIGDVVGSDVSVKLDNANFNLIMDRLTSEMHTTTTDMTDRFTGTPATFSGTGISAIAAIDYGGSIEGPVMVVDVGTTPCTSATVTTAPTTGTATVVGFVWGAIYDGRKRCWNGSTTVSCTGSNAPTTCATTGTLPQLARWGRFRFKVDVAADESGGGEAGGDDWGVKGTGGVRIIPNPE